MNTSHYNNRNTINHGVIMKEKIRNFIEKRKRIITHEAKDHEIDKVLEALHNLWEFVQFDQNSVKFLEDTEEVCYLSFHSMCTLIFQEDFYQSLVFFLLQDISTKWLPLFDPSSKANHFDIFFSLESKSLSPCNIFISLCAFVSSVDIDSCDIINNDNFLLKHDKYVAISNAVQLLECFLESYGFLRVFEEIANPSTSKKKTSLDVIVSYIGSITVLIHNRMRDKTPKIFDPKNFYMLLLKDFFEVSYHSTWENNNSYQQFVEKILQKVSRVGQTDLLCSLWVKQMITSKQKDRSVALIEIVPDNVLENIIFCLLEMKVDEAFNNQLVQMISPKLLVSSQCQYILCKKFVLKKSLSMQSLQRIMDIIIEASKQNKSIFHETFMSALKLWSQSNFVTKSDYSIQLSITQFLRLCLKNLTKEEAETLHATSLICKGVQDHLAHSLEKIRRLGMEVAEDLSILLDPENPLCFDKEDKEDENQDETSSISMETVQPYHNNNGNLQVIKPHSPIIKEIDPDEFVDLSSDSELDEDSDDSLTPYDLEDDEEDLQPHPKPVYLFQVVELLQCDDAGKIESALAVVSEIVRKQPSDLKQLSVNLTRALLRLENKYSLNDFMQRRSQGLVSLCVCCPVPVVQFFITQAFEKEQLYQSRVDILYTMMNSAYELAGLMDSKKDIPKLLMEEKGIISYNYNNQKDLKTLKTRRWGYRRDASPIPVSNQFGKLAGIFFYPLLHGYCNRTVNESNETIIDIESQFLSHFLLALSCFVECSGNASGTFSMAQSLIEFSWVHRKHSSPSVRRQVLYALSRVFLVIPVFLLRQDLMHQLIKFYEWTKQTANTDSDNGCREACKVLLDTGVFQSCLLIQQP